MLSKEKSCYYDSKNNFDFKKLFSTMVTGDSNSSCKNVPCTVTLSQRTDAVLLGLKLVLEHHCAPSFVFEDLNNQLHKTLDSSTDEMVWLKRAKYALTYPLAKYLKNPLPPKPDVSFEPSGRLRGWMKARLNAFNRRNSHLWYSWLQSKRCSLPASADIIEATYDKHLETLTRVDPGDDATIESIMALPIFQRLLEKIKKSVAKRYSRSESFVDWSASGSACFENTRRHAGQQGYLKNLCGIVDYEFDRDELVSMDYHPRAVDHDGRIGGHVSEKRCPAGGDLWSSLNHKDSESGIKIYTPIKCTIQGILEPMKVRVISKGEALPYYMCKPLQKALHGSMRDMDCFRLIGRPLCPTDFIDLAMKAKLTDKWFSVDYSAATDGLSWKYSGAIFRKVIEDLPEEDKIIALRVLGPHALHYPVQGRRDVVFKDVQQNGQLMGSILSFPILCLANLGVYLLNTNDSQKGWSDHERLRHVLINGDDMCYAADSALWESHIKIAGNVGLEMSVGKAYIHDVYANVNSTSVHLDLRKANYAFGDITGQETPWQIDYLNAGLFYGQHKVQNNESVKGFLTPGDEDPEVPDCWASNVTSDDEIRRLLIQHDIEYEEVKDNLLSSLNWLLKGCLPGRQGTLLARFLSQHNDLVRKETIGVYRSGGKKHLFTRNLFLPISLGGLGIEPPLGFRFKIKPIQRKVAKGRLTKLSRERAIPLSSQLPLPGYEVLEAETKVNVPWSRVVASPMLYSFSSYKLSNFSGKKLCSFQGIPFSESRNEIMINNFRVVTLPKNNKTRITIWDDMPSLISH